MCDTNSTNIYDRMSLQTLRYQPRECRLTPLSRMQYTCGDTFFIHFSVEMESCKVYYEIDI